MQALRIASLLFSTMGIMLLAVAFSGFFSGPISPASRFDLAAWMTTISTNQEIRSLGSNPNLIPMSFRAYKQGRQLVVDLIGRGRQSLSCEFSPPSEQAPFKQVAKSYLAYLKEPPSLEANCYSTAPIRIFEVNRRVRPVCPGQFATLGEHQVHNAMFLPLLDLDGAPSLLEAPDGREPQPCSTSTSVNCLVSESPFFYCGRIRADAEFRPRGAAKRSVKPLDVAVAATYFSALADANEPRDVTNVGCGHRPTGVYLYGLIEEVVTPETVRDFLQSNRTDRGRARTIRAALEGKESARNLCVVLAPVVINPEASQLDDNERAKVDSLVRAVLQLPTFAPFDLKDPGRASPILERLRAEATTTRSSRTPFSAGFRELNRRSDGDIGPCARPCRIHHQLKIRLEELGESAELDDRELMEHILGTGPFQVSTAEIVGYRLRAYGIEGSTKGGLALEVAGAIPEQLSSLAAQCENRGRCLFRGVWNKNLLPDRHPSPREERDFPSAVALFSRVGSNPQCARVLINRILSFSEKVLVDLQLDLTAPVRRDQAGPRNGWPTDVRRLGLLPVSVVKSSAEPFERGLPPARCRDTLHLAYLLEEPWRQAAETIAKYASTGGLDVEAYGLSSRALARGDRSWDVVLTVASYYTSRSLPTLTSILEGPNNPGKSSPLSNEGRRAWISFESCTLAKKCGGNNARLKRLIRLEQELYSGPAPILILNYLDPPEYQVGFEDGIDTSDPHLLSRSAWRARK